MIKAIRTTESRFTFYGTELVAERGRLGLTQARLAKLSGICQQHISVYERPCTITVLETTIKALERAGVKFDSIV